MTVCRRLLDLRHDNIIVPVVKPLRERVLARHDLRPPVLLDLVLIERTGRVALRVERPVLANTLSLAVNAVVKAHAVLVAALRNRILTKILFAADKSKTDGLNRRFCVSFGGAEGS